MGRPSNREERRRDLVEAALRVIATTGYDGASVQAIAKEANLSAGLLHHHFGSKAAVLEALVHTLEEKVDARHAALAKRRRGPWGRLQAWVDAQLATGDGADPRAVAAWVWIGAEALKGGAVRALYGEVMERRRQTVARLLSEAAQERSARIDADTMATTILAVVEGYYSLAASTDVVTSGTAAQAVRRLLERLLPEPT